MDDDAAAYENVPRLGFILGALEGGGLRPSVCDAMEFALTLKTSIHCWHAQGCPSGLREAIETLPLEYITFPFELEPETPTPKSALVEPEALFPPPAAPPGPLLPPCEAFVSDPETSG